MAQHETGACPAGGEITSTFDHPETCKLGSCKVIEEIMIGEDKLLHFSGVAMGEACTIVLRGASEQPWSRAPHTPPPFLSFALRWFPE